MRKEEGHKSSPLDKSYYLIVSFLKYYEKLSSKARAKPRSPSRCSSQDEDLGQRLEAKLQAAEQKRLSLLTKAQMRLARQDQLRQAAKNGVEMRHANERVKLGTKVESRVQQAEANRMLILKAHRQRRASLRERSSQSLMRRMTRESKYKERVRAAIHQKRAAAETKRLRLREAEKKRAHAQVLQARHVAKSVSHQREIERRKKKDELEDRLQRAKRQRAEYLRHRGRLRGYAWENWITMSKQAEYLSRKLARCWRRFLKQKRTTFSLTKAYSVLGINEKSVKSLPFEQFALLIESASTLQTVKTLLDRFESRLRVFTAVVPASYYSSLDNIDHLIKRVVSPKKRATPRSSARSLAKKADLVKETNNRLSRYQVRVVLCAYMILGHPDAVFSTMGEREIALAKSAQEFVHMFELLMKIILEGPIESSDDESASVVMNRCTFRSQLAAFDKAWCSYLNCFVVWKVKDARSLEDDLVRAACQLEASMIQTCKLTPEGVGISHDMKAIQHQVSEDQKLLREKVMHLSGDAGIERMESALSETRSRYIRVKDSRSPVGFPMTQYMSPSPTPVTTIASTSESNISNKSNKTSRVVRSLFKETDTSPIESSFSSPITSSNTQLSTTAEKIVAPNDVLVNEFLHEHHRSFADDFDVSDHIQNSIEGKIKQTMEKAFWDSVMESVKQDQPNYDQIIQLMEEVRDEICEMAPISWKDDIIAAIDLDILSQVLKSGKLDVNYLALVKGLQFVLEQIQILKREISKARIRLMEPLLKGPAGVDYLRNAFANKYGSPSDASASLPSTLRWLSSTWNFKDQEWVEHVNSSSALADNSSQAWLPSTTLRIGGNIMLKSTGSPMFFSPDVSNTQGDQQPECKGETVDLAVRLGLLKLVSGISGLTRDDLPETLSLNFSRLRSVQAQIQKIIVISTSVLICRQIILSEKAVASSADMENAVSTCVVQLLELLDRVEDADIDDIVGVICNLPSVDGEDAGKVQSIKAVAGRILGKSLQAGDAVFERVFNAVYSALRGVVLGGTGARGRKLAEMTLLKVGAGALTERVVEAARVLIVAATVSVGVHGPWYKYLTDNI
ncbi:unnamed protein product [Trifolium pratense]|uniref:Uncharacterized protein n=1 Tax=Trifolium pratense TaxID=57577 RepID=A0ACB0J722_TRIPR|nr:unnamed protein product [Trifolium pratense]